MKKRKTENNWNVPNFLAISRILLTLVIIFLIFADASVIAIVVLFIVAALTDFFDGMIARRYNLVTQFGKKIDMFADRFLWIATAVSFLIAFALRGELGYIHFIQLLFILSKEIIVAPFSLPAFIKGITVSKVLVISKVNNWVQTAALLSVILSIRYESFFYLSLPLSVVALVLGTITAFRYIKDFKQQEEKNVRTGRR